MRFIAARFAVAAFLALAFAACAARQSSLVPAGAGGGDVSSSTSREPVPNISGVYKGTEVETSQGRSAKEPLKITIKQSGDKFTGIFDIITKSVSDEFPIIKGVVSSSNGKVILHFIIEGSPHRNARATATLVNGVIKGKAKVSGKHGPAVRFTYSAKKT
jgi:hypothetical protein